MPGSRLASAAIPKMAQTTAIDLDVTDGCNLGCVYCFKNLDKPTHMSLDTAKDAIEWLFRASGDSPTVSVNFMGGEPILRFAVLKDLVVWGNRRARAVGKSIYWSFTSNLTLWTDEVREWVDANGIGVLMSIDGHPLIQDAQRPSKDRKPKAEIVAKWAKSLLTTRPESGARFTISPAYIDLLAEGCIYLWKDIGFKNVILADSDYDNWTDADFETYGQQCDRITEYMLEEFQAGRERTLELYKHYLLRLIHPRAMQSEIRRQNFPCGAGYNYSMIDQEGTIWPCHRFDGAAEDSGTEQAMKLGNIYRGEYNEALSNTFRNFDHSKIHKPECPTCPVEPICGGFCPAANLQHGKKSIYEPHDAYCRLKWMAYAKAEEYYTRLLEMDRDRTLACMNNWQLQGLSN